LLSVLAACDVQRGLIVVDDAHRISDPAVFEFLDLLLERLPPHWGVVLASRTDPPLASLARLRAHDELTEFRQRELRFTLDEVRALLPLAANAPLDREATSERLFQRTHGWAVGLRLAVNGILQFVRTGDTSTIKATAFGHAIDPVKVDPARMPDAATLRCSILEELTAALRRGERRSARGRMAQGDRAARPHSRCCRARDAAPARSVPRLPARPVAPRDGRRAAAAAQARRRRRDRDAAADRLLVGAGDWSEAEAMLGDAGATILATIGYAPVLRLLEKFPAEARRSSPTLLHVRCLAAWSRWDWATMRESAAAAAAAFARAGEPRLAWRSGVYEAIGLVIVGSHDEALRRLAVDPQITATRDDLALAGVVRSYVALDSGKLDDVAARYGEMLDLLAPSRDPVLWKVCRANARDCR
jgi:LuxR family maltose regulon positive regulatory protein